MDFATVKAVAQAVRKTDDIGWRPLQFVASGGSFVTTALKPAGLEKSVDIITASNVKDASDARRGNDPEIMKYRDVMGKLMPPRGWRTP